MMGDLDLHPSLFLFVPARRKPERGYVDARDVPPTASQDRAPYRPGTLSGEGLLRRERARKKNIKKKCFPRKRQL